jgi:hypothetical protein
LFLSWKTTPVASPAKAIPESVVRKTMRRNMPEVFSMGDDSGKLSEWQIHGRLVVAESG